MTGLPGTIDALPEGVEERLRERAEFDVLRAGEGNARRDYIVRWKLLDDAVLGDTVDDQAKHLSRWVLAAFQELEELIPSP